ncbi:hypothetical protein RCL_jg5122.t1 [Rhizophagus clarus]|uniref:Uncharacterized protein n=1 Tax=Rhizophagus clarus TaxID=94130 RepID=A0A8H3LY12_9GLOM|nr:hypothetical protein RCL_jg5122.t1 [Rhizophagus clarus]
MAEKRDPIMNAKWKLNCTIRLLPLLTSQEIILTSQEIKDYSAYELILFLQTNSKLKEDFGKQKIMISPKIMVTSNL